MTTHPSPDGACSFDVYSPDCPTRHVLDRLSSKWTGLAMVVLAEHPHHFGELRRRIAGISKKMMVQTLRALERDGLVSRTVVHDTFPPRVRYELTDLGATLVVPLQTIHEWAETHIGEVIESRDRHDAVAVDGASAG